MICPTVSIVFLRLHPYDLSVYIHSTSPSMPVLLAHQYPYHSPSAIDAIRPSLHMSLSSHTPAPRHRTRKETPRSAFLSSAGRSRSEGRRLCIAGRGAIGGAGRAGAEQQVSRGSQTLALSYLRPQGWRCRRWCAPPDGAWRTPRRSAPAPAPAPSPWPARAGGDGKMMKRRRKRRKVRRSTAYSLLPGAPGLTCPSCSSSAKGCQALRARLGGR